MTFQISENIRTLRKQHGLMQEGLAEALGVSTAAVSKWERGTATPELGYIAQMAEIFEVSIDVLVGYQIQSGNRESLEKKMDELGRQKEFEEAAKLAEIALAKYPNHFSTVYTAGMAYLIKGAETADKSAFRRAVELFERAGLLLHQNTEQEISEYTIQKYTAQSYLGMGQVDKCIEILKEHNPNGRNDALIGMLYASRQEYRPEEAEPYLVNAFSSYVLELIQTTLGYYYYYKRKGDYAEAMNTADWMIEYLQALKIDRTKISYPDKMISLLYANKAHMSDLLGREEQAEEYLKTAWELARDFDANPDNGVANVRFFLGDISEITLFDDIGISVTDAVENRLEEEEGGGRLTALWRQWK